MNFMNFKSAVAEQFSRMTKHQVFRTDVDGNTLWDTYLASFPEGSNPIYRKRREYDCSCCRQFIKAVGNAVIIREGQVVSLWDITVDDPEFQSVADAMSSAVKSFPIKDYFLHRENVAGTDKDFEDTVNGVQTWNHFFVNIPQILVAKSPEEKLGKWRTDRELFARALDTITMEAVDTVLELIAQNSLYRGAEHKHTVTVFKGILERHNQNDAHQRLLNTWLNTAATPMPVVGIRNSVIGTLLVDLSEGVDVDRAVTLFEVKVAPSNYKRPTAIVTKSMIESAKKTVEELGLTSALERRHATIGDISVNNVLFADYSAKPLMQDALDVFDKLAESVPEKTTRLSSKVEDVSIDVFLKDILPHATGVEVMMESRHSGNLVSLVAPVDPTAKPLFKWNNMFSWSYNGEMADSIKERVKQAGGNVTGDLCCRLSWFNTDDLDLHMVEPNGYEIYFGNRGRRSPGCGMLDVDMNAGYSSKLTRTPVENIFYTYALQMHEGNYRLFVKNFRRRETNDPGFTVELDFKGDVKTFNYPQAVRDNAVVEVARFSYTHKGGITIKNSLPMSEATRTVWNVPTNTFQKVNAIMLSPNFWDGQGVGNKHFFFMLDGCANETKARGFFNEFLRSDLDKHRKVIEMVGSKMLTDNSDKQLSGLGFSSTQKNSLLCKVTGSFTRVVNIVF